MCQHNGNSFACKNPLLGAPSLSQSTVAEEVCLHPALLCDWLTWYWAEQGASQVRGREGKQGISSGTCYKRQEGMGTVYSWSPNLLNNVSASHKQTALRETTYANSIKDLSTDDEKHGSICSVKMD